MDEEKKEIGVYIDRTYKVVRQDLLNRFKSAGIDITPEQWVILQQLEEEGVKSQTELANLSFKDRPTVSRIIDLLQKKEFVKRVVDKGDKRKFFVHLTQKGKDIIALAKIHVVNSREIAWQGLTEQEYQKLVGLLDKVFNNYK